MTDQRADAAERSAHVEQAAVLQAAYAAARREWQRVVWVALAKQREAKEAALYHVDSVR